MVTAAGILMAAAGVVWGTWLLGSGLHLGMLGWSFWILAFLIVVIGGVFTFKRKAWKLSLISSFLLLPVLLVPFLIHFEAFYGEGWGELNAYFAIVTAVLLLVGILPATIICVRKEEWKTYKRCHCPKCGQELWIPEGESQYSFECPDCGAVFKWKSSINVS